MTVIGLKERISGYYQRTKNYKIPAKDVVLIFNGVKYDSGTTIKRSKKNAVFSKMNSKTMVSRTPSPKAK